MNKNKLKVLILDMQPIDPPIGGGRIRLLGLYHNLGNNIESTYIGTYDWLPEKYRDHKLSDSLREIDVPLTKAHFEENNRISKMLNGKNVINLTFHQVVHKSPEYLTKIYEFLPEADVIIFSHPWIFPVVKDKINYKKQLVIYDSQNVEGFFQYTLFDDGGPGTDIVKEVVRIEFELCNSADIILACSFEDKELFNRLYGINFNKIKIVQNGVFTEKIKPVTAEKKNMLKKKLNLKSKTAIFMGSNYEPNIEAARFIITNIADNFPDSSFVIAGGIGESFKNINLAKNVKITGIINEDEKLSYLNASDIALNPMFSGSGTNIKMFDFMAAGLPIISTDIGARGITDVTYKGVIISNKDEFNTVLKEILNTDNNNNEILSKSNRMLVEKEYSWEKISISLGKFIINNYTQKNINYADDLSYLKKNEKLSILTPWDIKCGVAEYSKYLINSIQNENIFCLIFGNQNHESINPIFENYCVYNTWYYDCVNYNESSINFNKIIKILKFYNIHYLNIQYHIGFFPENILLELFKKCYINKINLSITFHNIILISNNIFMNLKKYKVKVFCHKQEDINYIKKFGYNSVNYIPQGVLEIKDEDQNDIKKMHNLNDRIIIGSFGFIREYKGIYELIEAINILKKDYPDIFLLGLNALYPSEDSKQYYAKCLNLIKKLNLNKNINIISDFLKPEEIINYLHACDIICLPYYPISEGASAAANMAFASKRPVITSNSNIFDEIKNYVCMFESLKPKIIAETIKSVLSNNEKLLALKNKSISYSEKNSWTNISKIYIDLIFN